MRAGIAAALMAAVLVTGCVKPTAPVATTAAPSTPKVAQAVVFDDIAGWKDDALTQSLPALRAECQRLALLPADTPLGGDALAAAQAGRAGQWMPACGAARSLTPGDETAMRHFYETWFTAYRIDSPGLFTGYYEPEVNGSRKRGGIYQTPLLAHPDDLVQRTGADGTQIAGRLVAGKLVPYWSRAEILAGRAGTHAHALFWLADPVDLFFLQIQGAGRIRLPNRTIVRVGYDGKNGRPYTPIGRLLEARHAIAENTMSLQTIRAWLKANPKEAPGVMNANEDYVFFRVLPDTDAEWGPPGAMGVKLEPGRAAAVDRRFVPLGAPLFVDTTDPRDGSPWRHLVLAQDVGSDILGPARADIFVGAGANAEALAGRMHQAGTEYVLLPKS
jgi:membrane-bound lytic murein transglycosylase A